VLLPLPFIDDSSARISARCFYGPHTKSFRKRRAHCALLTRTTHQLTSERRNSHQGPEPLFQVGSWNEMRWYPVHTGSWIFRALNTPLRRVPACIALITSLGPSIQRVGPQHRQPGSLLLDLCSVGPVLCRGWPIGATQLSRVDPRLMV
jgi:hypothetical protein